MGVKSRIILALLIIGLIAIAISTYLDYQFTRQGTAENTFIALELTNLYWSLAELAVAVAVVYLLIFWAFRPIKALRIAVERIAAGDLNQKLRLTGKDEIGKLAIALDRK